MIDERNEELASLYALDLLEGAERAQFEAAVARDPELQALVRGLREASAMLAHTASHAAPPAALKERVLASAADAAASARPESAAPATADNVVRPPDFTFRVFLPFAIAAGFALAAAWFARLHVTSRSEAEILRDQVALVEITATSARQQLEAERILARQQLQNLDRQVAETARELEQARAQARSAQDRIAQLTNDLQRQGDVANFKIAALASMLNFSPQAIAVAAWDPLKQEGVFAIEKVAGLSADEILELWVIEAKPGAQPVSAGVFDLGSDGTARVHFKPSAPVGALATFAVSREKRDGLRIHPKPNQVVMLGHSR